MKHFAYSALLLSLCNPALAQTAPVSNTGPAASVKNAAPVTSATANSTATATTAATAAGTDISAPPPESSTAADTPGPRIYLVARIKLTGTDLTQAVFFQHPAMTTMEACEAERAGGLMNNWSYFGRFYLKTLKGVTYKVDYRCVESETRLAYWRQGVPNSISYLVRTGDNKLKVSSHSNFFDCRDALRAVAKEENVDNFCAVSSQTILPDAPPQG